MRVTPALPAPSSSLARFSIQEVIFVSAGPPLGGLYLMPPSSGGLWDGVMTMPSESPSLRPRLYVRIACDTTGVGVHSPSFAQRTSTPFVTSTSRQVTRAGPLR